MRVIGEERIGVDEGVRPPLPAKHSGHPCAGVLEERRVIILVGSRWAWWWWIFDIIGSSGSSLELT